MSMGFGAVLAFVGAVFVLAKIETRADSKLGAEDQGIGMGISVRSTSPRDNHGIDRGTSYCCTALCETKHYNMGQRSTCVFSTKPNISKYMTEYHQRWQNV